MHLVLSTLFYLIYMAIMFLILNRRFRKKNKKITIIFIIIISLFFFLKKLGLDFEMYVNWYNKLDTSAIYNFRIELIPYLFMYISKLYNLPSHAFFFLIGTVTVILNYQIFKNYNNMLLSLFLLFYLFFFRGFSDAMRQLLAASFILYSIYSFQIEQKKIKSLVLFVFALFSHYSSIAMIPAYFLLKFITKTRMQVNLKFYIIFIFLTIVLFQVINLFLQQLATFSLGTFENKFMNMIIFKLQYYLFYYQQKGYTYLNILHKVFWYLIVILPEIGSIMINVYLIKIKAYYDMDKFLKFILIMSILGNIIFIGFSSIGLYTMGNRISLTLTLGTYLLLTHLFQEKKHRQFYKIILIYYLIYNIIVLIYYIQPFNPYSPAYIL